MAADIDEITRVATSTARELNKVKSAGQARTAAGQALVYLSHGYALVDGLNEWKTGVDKVQEKKKLDAIRKTIESGMKALPATDSWQLSAGTFEPLRAAITRVVVEVAGYEGIAGNKPTWGDVLHIVAEAAQDAPRVFGKAVGSVAAGVGKTAGTLAGGILSGLGIWSIVLLAVLAFVAVRYVKAAAG